MSRLDSNAPAFCQVSPGIWRPSELARGPFGGVQGGAAAGLMALEVARSCGEFSSSISTHFLRPTPLADLEVVVRPLKRGRRVGFVDAELRVGGDAVAVQRHTLMAALECEGLPTPPERPAAPHGLPPAERPMPAGRPWLMDTMDVRRSPDGLIWFRQRRPIFGGDCDTARVLAAADWCHGLTPPCGATDRPEASIPNVDLMVHMMRPPNGDWIGVQPSHAWSAAARGLGWGGLFDVSGPFGRVAMSVAVFPPGAA